MYTKNTVLLQMFYTCVSASIIIDYPLFLVIIYSTPRTQVNGIKTRLKIDIWYMLSLYKTGACQNLTDVLKTYGVHITSL